MNRLFFISIFSLVMIVVLNTNPSRADGKVLQQAVPTPTATIFSSRPQWPTAISLSNENESSWFPDIVTEPSGKIHVVWSSAYLNYDTVVYSSSEDGINWSKPNDIFANRNESGSSVTRPSIILGPSGKLELSLHTPWMFFQQSEANTAGLAQSWEKTPQILTNQIVYFTQLLRDQKNILFLFFTENTPTAACQNCFHLNVIQSTDDGMTWSQPIDISGGNIGAVKPQMVVDQKNKIHLVWESGMGGDLGQLSDPTRVMYAYSDDEGRTWSSPQSVGDPKAVSARNITIGADSSGNLIMAWLELPEDKVYFRISYDLGLSWSTPKNIPNVWGTWQVYQARLDRYSMATDGNGNIHLIMVGRLAETDTQLHLMNLFWNGYEWSKPDVIQSYSGDAPEWPRASFSADNRLAVVWFVRDQAHIFVSDAGRYRIWYAYKQVQPESASQATKPALSPTTSGTTIRETSTPPVATSTIMPATASTASSTFVPPRVVAPVIEATLTDQQKQPDEKISSESEFLLLFLKALLPTLIAIVMIGAYFYFRRR